MEKDSNLREGGANRFKSAPFGHSGIEFQKADDRTRTDNLLITNQLLCQLSHIGEITNTFIINGTNRARTYDPLLVRQMLSQLSYDPLKYLISCII